MPEDDNFFSLLPNTDLKCGLVRRFWTGGYGTERDKACSRWEEKPR